MALLHEEGDDHNHKYEKNDKAQRTGTHWNLNIGEFVIVAKLLAMCCII